MVGFFKRIVGGDSNERVLKQIVIKHYLILVMHYLIL